MLCVHGCKSLMHESIDLADRNRWDRLVVLCCLQSEHHLGIYSKVKLPDETRFALLCGALAARYRAETVEGIDPRITARGIVITSSASNGLPKWGILDDA